MQAFTAKIGADNAGGFGSVKVAVYDICLFAVVQPVHDIARTFWYGHIGTASGALHHGGKGIKTADAVKSSIAVFLFTDEAVNHLAFRKGLRGTAADAFLIASLR